MFLRHISININICSYLETPFFTRDRAVYRTITLRVGRPRKLDSRQDKEISFFLCFIDRVSLYNLVNKANLVHDFS
jgi:hypothetical protein